MPLKGCAESRATPVRTCSLLLHAGGQSRVGRRGRYRRAGRARHLLAVCGLRIGTGVSERIKHNRVGGRLLTIEEWHQRELPRWTPLALEWLLIGDCAASDVTATRLADAFGEHSAACATMQWPRTTTSYRRRPAVIKLVATRSFAPAWSCSPGQYRYAASGGADRGAEYVRRLVGIARG